MALDDSNSFFNNSDFDFAESVEDKPEKNLFHINTYRESESEVEELDKNTIQLILFNNEAVLGDKIHGAVKIYVNKTLLEGKVVLVLESTLKINKPVQKTKIKMTHHLKSYQTYI